MSTHTFKLPSGPNCEIRSMKGKHQKWATEQTGNMQAGLNKILKDIIVDLGGIKEITDEVLEGMLTADRKKILTEARQFTLDFDPVFKFIWKYRSVAKKTKGQQLEVEKEIDLSTGFPCKPFKQQFETYEEVLAAKEIELVLPKSGDKAVYRMLDGKGSAHASTIKQEQYSSHTPIEVRNLRIYEGTEKTVPVRANLDNMEWKDIEAVRSSIHENEGKVDTELMFDHPEADLLPASKRDVVIDMTGELAFFFPSGRI